MFDLIKWKTLTIMYQANNSMLPHNIQNIFHKIVMYIITLPGQKLKKILKWKLVERKQCLLLLVFLLLNCGISSNFHSFKSLMAWWLPNVVLNINMLNIINPLNKMFFTFVMLVVSVCYLNVCLKKLYRSTCICVWTQKLCTILFNSSQCLLIDYISFINVQFKIIILKTKFRGMQKTSLHVASFILLSIFS